MYGKIHDTIFSSSIMEEDLTIRYVWICMIAAADRDGVVDATIPALARRFNVTVNEMIKSIESFQKEDISSRSKKHNGKRIVPIRESFGWKLVNYEDYCKLQSTNDRRDYMKNYMSVRRSKLSVNKSKPKVSTLADVDVDVDVSNTTKKILLPKKGRKTTLPDDFVVTEKMREFAIKKGVPASEINGMTDHFSDYWVSKGGLFSDWVAAWRTWVRNSKTFGNKFKPTDTGENKWVPFPPRV